MPSYTTLIEPAALEALLGHPELVCVDCRFSLADTERGRRAYAEEHIPGAWYAHLDEDLSGAGAPQAGRHPLPSPEQAARTFRQWGIGPDSQVVAYDDMSGAIAARLWWMLGWLGHDKVAVLDGGWTRWLAEDRPRSKELPQAAPGRFVAKPRADWLIDLETLRADRAGGALRLLDARTAERYRGEAEPIDPVAGHIPGAINAPHTEVVDEQGHWLTPEQLQKRFSRLLDGTPPERVACYCGSGVTACRNILAMRHAGMPGARLFPPSWSGWIADPKHPVATGEEA